MRLCRTTNLLSIVTLLTGLCAGWLAPAAHAQQPFDLPSCSRELGGAAVLNTALLDAMLTQAQPTGGRPNPSAEQLFVLLKHYVTQHHGLLLVSGTADHQLPVLLTMACAPLPATPVHVRTYLSQLPAKDKQSILDYQALVMPAAPQAAPAPMSQPANSAVIPGGEWHHGDGKSTMLKAFVMDVYEVTNAQYQQFIEADGYGTATYWSPEGWAWVQSQQRRQPTYWGDERFHAADQPVVGVTWHEAAAYCRWAGKALPTEVQWEKACRGTDKRAFPWGNTPLAVPETAANPTTAAAAIPAAVGSTPATQSPYGVQDMAGNVLEWTSSTSGKAGVVLCGGSGKSTSPYVGCGVRITLLPGLAANFIGFRCQAAAP